MPIRCGNAIKIVNRGMSSNGIACAVTGSRCTGPCEDQIEVPSDATSCEHLNGKRCNLLQNEWDNPGGMCINSTNTHLCGLRSILNDI